MQTKKAHPIILKFPVKHSPRHGCQPRPSRQNLNPRPAPAIIPGAGPHFAGVDRSASCMVMRVHHFQTRLCLPYARRNLMSLTLPDLPYPYDALAPYMSRETLEYHHDKHHLTYVNNANNLMKGSEWEGKSLED